MSMLHRCRATFRALFKKTALDRELDRELSQWVNELAARHEAAGVPPEEARRRALIETGGVEQVKEQVRDSRPRLLLDGLARDASYACRSLLRSPGLFAAVIATLALGIGANTAVYSVVHTILLEDPPYRDPGRLTLLLANMEVAGIPRARLAGPEVVDFRRDGTSFSGVAAIQPASAAITGDGPPEQIVLARVTPDFFDVLGVEMAAGRAFVSGDGYPNPVPPVVIGWPLFERRFGGDFASIGRRVVIDGVPVQIAGVLRSDFRLHFLQSTGFPSEPQVYQPFAIDLAEGNRLIRLNHVVARLADGVSLETAAAQVAHIGSDLARRDSTYRDARHTFYVVPMLSDSTREVRPMLYALLAGVVVVLVAACVNVSGLLLARAVSRRREIATLAALGANRARLARQFVLEGLFIAAAGALAGVGTGIGVLRVIVALRPPSLDRLDRVAIDAPVLMVVAAIACLWGLVFALVPLAEFSRLRVAGNLEPGGGRVAGRLRYRARSTLVVVQIALGTVLAVASTLLVRTTNALYQVDAGFDLDVRALTFRVVLPADRYPRRSDANAFSRRLEERLRAIPGVEGAGAITHVPFDPVPGWSGKYLTEAENTPSGQASARFASMRAVSPETLQLLGVQLVAGRWFSERDDASGEPVSIIDERLAARAWPGQPAIGQRLRVPYEIDRRVAAVWTTVVGVVRHARYRTLNEEGAEQAYVPARQTLRAAPIAYVARTAVEPMRVAADVSRAVTELDPLLPAYDIKAYETYVIRATSAHRFTTVLTASFAFLALALAAIGLTALVNYSVTARLREFGVRLAVGATPAGLQRSVLAQALMLVAAGVGLGLVAATVTSNAMRGLLYGVSPTDVASYGGAVVALALVGICATWWPARQAAGVNPAEALRSE